MRPGGFEVVDEPVADEQSVGRQDAAHLKFRAQEPKGVRIRFAETRDKREKAQLRLENSAAQLRGGQGGVELA
jgi:hypothetical protein